MKKLFLLPISFFLLASTCDNKKDPIDSELINRETYPFENKGTNLIAIVSEGKQFETAKDGDCNLPHVNTYKEWEITNENDFIEVTIQVQDGVLPGVNNARAFGLYNSLSSGKSTLKLSNLVIESDLTNIKKVYTVAWKFHTNAIEDLNNEIVLSGTNNLNNPYNRKINNIKLGRQWTITVPAAVKPENVTASIRYNINMGNVKICN